MIVIGLSPDGFALWLHATHGTEDRHCAIEYAQASFDFDGEIDVSRRVNDVDSITAVPVPVTHRGSARNRDTALLLFGHPVHRRSAVVNLADAVSPPGEEQDTLRRRRFSGINVRHDTNVTHLC